MYDKSLLKTEEKIQANARIKENKAGFIKEMAARIQHFDETNF